VSIVHVVNGESTALTLAEAELPGDITVWADALEQGPLLPLPEPEYRAAREAFWASRGAAGPDGQLARWDQAVDDAAQGAEEVVLWYEHDLFDQLALIRLLARLGKTPPRAQVTIVSIDRHDDVPDFKGLGQLEAYQLAALWPRRTPLAREAIDEAAAAWIAMTAPDPRGVAYLARRIRVLPFLGFALERHLEDFPDAATGLSRTEAQIVRAVDRGLDSLASLLAATPAGERYYLTDTAIWHHVRTLVGLGFIAADEPLAAALASGGAAVKGVAGAKALKPTALGRDVLAGKVDRVAHAGIDEWRGGVRLLGKGPVWRFDLASRRIVFA
jgi:Domain of unknown function (DUF1835)